MIMIDPPVWPGFNRVWSHLVSDESFEELHAFARSVGIPARGFDRDHYDVPSDKYDEMIAAGAVPVPSRVLVRRLIDSGLRHRKTRAPDSPKNLERICSTTGSADVRTRAIGSWRHPPPSAARGTALRQRRAKRRLPSLNTGRPAATATAGLSQVTTEVSAMGEVGSATSGRGWTPVVPTSTGAH